MSHIRICSCCGKHVKVVGKRRQKLYTYEGKLLTEPFICGSCTELIDEFNEPDEEEDFNEIEDFYPDTLEIGVSA